MARRCEIKKQTDSTYYTFGINPINFENFDNQNMDIGITIDGYSFVLKSPFDSRPRVMEWVNLPNKSPYNTMISTFRTLIGEACHLRLNYLTGSTSDTTVQNIRVVDLQTKWKMGPQSANAYLSYDYVRLIYVPI